MSHVTAYVSAGSVNTQWLPGSGRGLASGGGLQGWPQLSPRGVDQQGEEEAV